MSINVQIECEEVPKLSSDHFAEDKSLAGLFRWPIRFLAVGENGKLLKKAQGYILQRVEGRKVISRIDSKNKIRHYEDQIDVWEAFCVIGGRSETIDLVQLIFEKRAKTTTSLTLSAAFMPELNCSYRDSLNSGKSQFGANCLVEEVPDFFDPTISREIYVSVDDLNNSRKVDWIATASPIYPNGDIKIWHEN